jgi:hypothetical protein
VFDALPVLRLAHGAAPRFGDEAGLDAVDGDAIARQFERRAAQERIDASLRRRVMRAATHRTRDDTDDVTRMRPTPTRFMCGTAACVSQIAALRFSASTSSSLS